MIFDQEHMERQRALDDAFAAGARYAREHADEDLVAQCVALRVGLAKAEAAAYREGIEAAFWFVVILASLVVAAWVLLIPVIS